MADFDNLTAEESDNLLRQEIFAEEDNSLDSGINESEEQVEAQEEAPEQSEEVDTEETTEQEEQEVTPEQPKKKSNVAKILAEKNEYKKQALEAKAMVEELRSKLGQDSDTDVSFFESKMKQMLAENNEKMSFFGANP